MQNPRTRAEQQQHKAKLANSYSELLSQFGSKELTHVGNYSIGRLIGKGSFGKVYLARNNLIHGSKVVLKASSKEDANLAREIHWHRQFSHPHIVRLYEVIVTELSVYLVLEYVSGSELYDHICSHGPLPVERVQKIFTQLVGAVAYIHGRQCVHRDLKLENVLLDRHDNVKLLDFGMTREYEGNASYMQTFCGTVCYSAPEMLKGEKYAAVKVDVWSLGIILYALLKGELPFDEDDDTATKSKILKDDPIFPETFPEAAVHLLKKMLSKRPFHRPTLSDILADPFLAEHAPQQQAVLKLTQPAPFSTDLEKHTLERLKAAGVDIDKVIESVLSQRCDGLAGWWTLLYEKEQRKDARREKKRKEREAEIKLLRRLSGASGRFSAIQPTLPEVDEDARPEENDALRGRSSRRNTAQVLPQLPEGGVQNSGAKTPPTPIDKDRSPSGSRPPLPPKGPSREYRRRSSNLQMVVSNSDFAGPVNGVGKRTAQTKAGRLKSRNNAFMNQLAALKNWLVDSTKRAKSPMGRNSQASSNSQKSPSTSRFKLTPDKLRSQSHLSVPKVDGDRPGHQDRTLSGTSTVLTRKSSYGDTLTPVISAGIRLDTTRAINHQKTYSGSSIPRTSISPSPLTPRGSRRLSSGPGLRGRKSTSSSVSSIRSMPRHAAHSKASSISSNSLDTIHSPAGSRSGSMHHTSRSPHSSLKVLPAGPVFTSNGRLIRNTEESSEAGGDKSQVPMSRFNEAMIGTSTGGVMFARRKKSAFKGPQLNAGLFGQQIGGSMGSPAVFNRQREGSDGKTNLLFGRRKGSNVTDEAPASSNSTPRLGIPEEPTPSKRKSVIVEEDEDEEETPAPPGSLGSRNGMLTEEDEEDLVEEVDNWDEPVLRKGERLDSITFIDDPPVFTISEDISRVSSRVVMSPDQVTPMETPKISVDGGTTPSSPGTGIGLGESASTPRLDLGREWSK
jgi:serine/threonine protein kinase